MKYKSILITGGTGSFGKAFISFLLKKFSKVEKIVILSRDEFKQFEMQESHPYKENKKKLRFFIGDIRDKDRLMSAFEDIDVVIHAAALKQVPTAEYNPFEYIKTNVLGAQNIIESAFYNKVKKVIALSTDKACSPINLYGATKLCSDKLFVSANNIAGSKNTRFSVVRYGNVLSSRGSVVPFFQMMSKKSIIPVTDERMTRFSITLQESVDLVVWAINNSFFGGEIFVPKISSYKILDLVKAISPKSKIIYTGIRAGEKIHEELIARHESLYGVDLGDKYVLLPQKKIYESFISKFTKAMKLPKDFSYNSFDNKNYLSISELKAVIEKN